VLVPRRQAGDPRVELLQLPEELGRSETGLGRGPGQDEHRELELTGGAGSPRF
jgi:hypothetical protein